MPNSISLQFSVFEGINRVFYVDYDAAINLSSISFIKCTHVESASCFYISNNGTTDISIKNVCFISCTSKNSGIGIIGVKTQNISLIQISSSDMIRSDQRDAIYLLYGNHFVDGLNTSKCAGISPQITCAYATTGEYKFMKAKENNPSQSIIFFCFQHTTVKSCTFISNIFKNKDNGAVWLDTATASIVNCDFVNNDGPLFCCLKSEATCEECFYEGNFITQAYQGVKIVSTRVIANKDLWDVITHKCHLINQLSFTERSQNKNIVIITAASLLGIKHLTK